MTKTNISVKNIDMLPIEERANIIQTIVSSHFQTNDDGEIQYTPYFCEVGKVIAISKYLIDGISFDENESVYNSVINDSELKRLVDNITSTDEFQDIMDTVNEIVEYKKAENIARIQNETNSVIAYKMLELVRKDEERSEKESEALDNLNQWIDEQRELNSLITPEMQRNFAEKFDPNALTDAIIKKYSESDLYKKNKEVIEANSKLREKDNKIVSMQNELKRKEQKDDVKNVLADK